MPPLLIGKCFRKLGKLPDKRLEGADAIRGGLDNFPFARENFAPRDQGRFFRLRM